MRTYGENLYFIPLLFLLLVTSYGRPSYGIKTELNPVRIDSTSLQRVITESVNYSINKQTIKIDSIRSIRKPIGLPLNKTCLNKNLEKMSGFGYRKHPILKQFKLHTGFDLSCPKGSEIRSPASGKIVRIEYKNTGYGNNIIIEHNSTYSTLYAHLSKINVKPGQLILKGDIIGEVGSTGRSTGPHLHYEVIKKGRKVNPVTYF